MRVNDDSHDRQPEAMASLKDMRGSAIDDTKATKKITKGNENGCGIKSCAAPRWRLKPRATLRSSYGQGLLGNVAGFGGEP